MAREDNGEGRRYWPFEALPTEKQTERHRQEIRFLEATHAEGFRPYTWNAGNFGATARERSALILVRGRSRCEVVLGTADVKSASAFLEDFATAAEAVLEWLRGAEIGAILSRMQSHLVRMPGASHSFVFDAVPENVALP